MFLAQALSEDRSCQKAVNDAAVQRLTGGLPQCSTHTGGYCHARQRLPVDMVSSLTQCTGRLIATHTPATWHWQGRPVRLVDGTTVTMPDTPANQTAYPQPRSQQSGLGFPLCRLLSILCLGSGAVLNAAIGTYRGKGGDEQTLLRSLANAIALAFGDTTAQHQALSFAYGTSTYVIEQAGTAGSALAAGDSIVQLVGTHTLNTTVATAHNILLAS